MLDTNLLGCRHLLGPSLSKEGEAYPLLGPGQHKVMQGSLLLGRTIFVFILFFLISLLIQCLSSSFFSEGEKLSMHKFKEKYLAHFHHTIMQDIKMVSFNVKGAQVQLKK